MLAACFLARVLGSAVLSDYVSGALPLRAAQEHYPGGALSLQDLRGYLALAGTPAADARDLADQYWEMDRDGDGLGLAELQQEMRHRVKLFTRGQPQGGQLFVRNPLTNRATPHDFLPTDTIGGFLDTIAAPPRGRWMLKERQGRQRVLRDSLTFAHYNVQPDQTLDLMIDPDSLVVCTSPLDCEVGGLLNNLTDSAGVVFVGIGSYDFGHGANAEEAIASILRQQCPPEILRHCTENEVPLSLVLIDSAFEMVNRGQVLPHRTRQVFDLSATELPLDEPHGVRWSGPSRVSEHIRRYTLDRASNDDSDGPPGVFPVGGGVELYTVAAQTHRNEYWTVTDPGDLTGSELTTLFGNDAEGVATEVAQNGGVFISGNFYDRDALAIISRGGPGVTNAALLSRFQQGDGQSVMARTVLPRSGPTNGDPPGLF